MDDAPARGDTERSTEDRPVEGPALTLAQQRRNIGLFAACTGLQYLAGPVLYVGQAQAALLDELNASPTVANLPESAFYLMTFAPVLLAQWLPGVRWLKRSLVICYLAEAVALAAVVALLHWPTPSSWKVAAIIVQGAVTGAAMTTAIALLWEAVGRGVAVERRRFALALAFGGGPFLALAGSLGMQWILTRWEFPTNFAVVFGGAVWPMLAAAALASRFQIPADTATEERIALWAGVARFLSHPVFLWATVVTILLYVGNTILANLGLFTRYAMGLTPTEAAGNQLAIRFAFKGVAGLLLGWGLSGANPRAGILATGLILLAAPLWGLFATGGAYLIAFGLFGAGELVGVYAPNYILTASASRDFRRHLAYVTMLMAPTAPAGALFGAIAQYGATDAHPESGFRWSFVACALILSAGLALTVLKLPPHPRPEE